MAESEQITYHVTTSQTWFQNRSQIFVPFWELEKATFTASSLQKRLIAINLPRPEKYQLWRLNWWNISPPLFCNVLDGYSFPIPILALLRNRKIHSLQIMHIIGLLNSKNYKGNIHKNGSHSKDLTASTLSVILSLSCKKVCFHSLRLNHARNLQIKI